MANTTCPWCRGLDSDPDPATLCRTHEAEYEGLTLSELDRSYIEQYAEWADTLG